jgi:hypothetical protein
MLDQAVSTAHRLARDGYPELGFQLLRYGVERARARVERNHLGSQQILACWQTACDTYGTAHHVLVPREAPPDAAP